MNSRSGLLALVLVGGLLALSCFQVNESETVVVTRFGSPARTLEEPGLYFKWPAPVDALLRVSKKTQVLEIESQEYLTAEKKNILVGALVAWSVADPMRFLKSANDRSIVQDQLTDIVHTHIGNVLGEQPLEALLSIEGDTNRIAAIDASILERTAADALETYGVRVRLARIRRLSFPSQNKKAVFRRMEAERQKIAQEIRTQGIEESERIRSDVDRETGKLIAEAKAKAERLRGEGDAEAAELFNEAYAQDPELYKLLRFMDAYEDMFDERSTLLIPSDDPLLNMLRVPEGKASATPGAVD